MEMQSMPTSSLPLRHTHLSTLVTNRNPRAGSRSTIHSLEPRNAAPLHSSTMSSKQTTLGSPAANSPSSSSSSSSSTTSGHLYAKAFRQTVLAPHGIRIYDAPSKQPLPRRLLRLIEDMSQNLEQFDPQLAIFRQKVAAMEDVSGSELLSHDTLPSLHHETRINRSAQPTFSHHSIPERVGASATQQHSLLLPHATFACGFPSSTFNSRELSVISPSLSCHSPLHEHHLGFAVHTTETFYATFLTFQQAYGPPGSGFNVAKHQCAINGACSVRALQVLYLQADKKAQMPLQPQAFSCYIDTAAAIINHHWIDKDQNYCMAPICRFELTKDNHFRLLMAWIGAIEMWAVIELLPQIKAALNALPYVESSPSCTPWLRATSPTIPSYREENKCTPVMTSLKTQTNGQPRRADDESSTSSYSAFENGLCCSATESCGSPVSTEITAPDLGERHSAQSESTNTSQETVKAQAQEQLQQPISVLRSVSPIVEEDIDTLEQERLISAVDQVHGLESQLQDVKSRTRSLIRSLQQEMSRLGRVHRILENELVRANQHVREVEHEIQCPVSPLEATRILEPVILKTTTSSRPSPQARLTQRQSPSLVPTLPLPSRKSEALSLFQLKRMKHMSAPVGLLGRNCLSSPTQPTSRSMPESAAARPPYDTPISPLLMHPRPRTTIRTSFLQTEPQFPDPGLQPVTSVKKGMPFHSKRPRTNSSSTRSQNPNRQPRQQQRHHRLNSFNSNSSTKPSSVPMQRSRAVTQPPPQAPPHAERGVYTIPHRRNPSQT